MFTEEDFRKYKITTQDKSIGKIEVNLNMLKQYPFYHPFFRTDKKEITKFGTRNTVEVENYIIRCLNDYYAKLTGNQDLEERQKMLDKYMHLYSMWRELYNYKNANDLVNINNMYDLFLYELYTMGYVI